MSCRCRCRYSRRQYAQKSRLPRCAVVKNLINASRASSTSAYNLKWFWRNQDVQQSIDDSYVHTGPARQFFCCTTDHVVYQGEALVNIIWHTRTHIKSQPIWRLKIIWRLKVLLFVTNAFFQFFHGLLSFPHSSFWSSSLNFTLASALRHFCRRRSVTSDLVLFQS